MRVWLSGTQGLAVLLAVLGFVAAGASGTALAATSASEIPPVIDFTFDQFPPPGKGQAATRVVWVCASDGRFRAVHQELPDGGEPVTTATQEGMLDPAELQPMLGAIRDLDWGTLAGTTQNLGFASAPMPGWKGALVLHDAAAQHRVQFTSLRSAAPGERSVTMNRLVTVVFDLKNLALAKLGLAPVRASPENALSQ